MSAEGNGTRFELSHDAIARLVFDQASAEARQLSARTARSSMLRHVSPGSP